MPRKSKGVVIGQIFIYIIAIIVFAIVLIFGYQAINGFLEKGEQVAYITFKTDLENAVQQSFLNFGSVTIYNQKNVLAVPSKYDRVCFVDLDYGGNRNDQGICSRNHPDFNPIVCDAWGESWEAGDQNVFLEPMGLSPIKVVKIEFESSGYLCLDVVQGRLHMRLEGKGNHVLISEESVT